MGAWVVISPGKANLFVLKDVGLAIVNRQRTPNLSLEADWQGCYGPKPPSLGAACTTIHHPRSSKGNQISTSAFK